MVLKHICIQMVISVATMVCVAAGAQAQSCVFTMPNFDFGDIDLTLGTQFNLTANLTATCTGTPGATIRFCPNIEAGSGGHSGTGDPRYMLNGANQLDYNIFRNGAFSNIWGSRFWPHSNPPQPRLTLNGAGTGSRTRPVRVRIYGGQTTLPVGLYTTSFAGIHTLFSYDYFTGQNCGVIGATNGVQVPFTIQANHIGSCTVVANNLNFGTIGVLNTNNDSSSTMDVTCTSGASYQVGLNGGLTGATDPTLRKMEFGVEQITYGLYQDTGRLMAWGDTIGTNTVTGTGTGAAQTLTVYGRIPPQTTPSPATYSDTIVVTVTY